MKVEKEVLVLGVGDLLLEDEGAGIYITKALGNERLPARTHLMGEGMRRPHSLSWL